MKSLLHLLPEMIRLSGDQDDVREQASFVAWRVTVGQQLAQTCRPFRLYRTTLVVAVLDETWKKQMESMSRMLIFKLNALVGQKVITFIEFRVDADHVAAGLPKERTRDDSVIKVDEELVAVAAGIKDDELRELFLRTATRAIHNNAG